MRVSATLEKRVSKTRWPAIGEMCSANEAAAKGRKRATNRLVPLPSATTRKRLEARPGLTPNSGFCKQAATMPAMPSLLLPACGAVKPTANAWADGLMRAELEELFRYRELLLMLALRDIKIRYKQSLMGFFWAILMPMLIVAAGIVVRYAYAAVANKPLNLFDFFSLAVKSVVWAFLVSSIRFSCLSLLSNSNLVSKVYFPKEVLPIAAIFSQLFDLCVAGGVLVVLMIAAQLHPTIQLLWVGPLLMIAVVLATGTGLLVSTGALFFRDVRYIVEVVLTFAIFFTPVFYDASMLGPKGRWLLLNPAAPLMEGFSAVVHGRPPDWLWTSYSCCCAVALLAAGYALLKKTESVFAESI